MGGIKLTLYQSYPGIAYDTLKKIGFLWPIANIAMYQAKQAGRDRYQIYKKA